MLHFKLKEKTCRTLCKFDLKRTPDILGWVKKSDIEIMQYILIELSELVVFDFGLSDTQDGLWCLRIGIYILWLTSSPCDNNSGERFRAHGPSCFWKWAGIQHKVQVGICVQQRFKSVCTFAQSDQILSLLPDEMLDPWLSIEHPSKTDQKFHNALISKLISMG